MGLHRFVMLNLHRLRLDGVGVEMIVGADDSELVANYWNAYFNWRTGQLGDEAIATVVRSIWEQVHSHTVSGSEAARLKKLARMIEEEISSLEDDDEITWVA